MACFLGLKCSIVKYNVCGSVLFLFVGSLIDLFNCFSCFVKYVEIVSVEENGFLLENYGSKLLKIKETSLFLSCSLLCEI